MENCNFSHYTVASVYGIMIFYTCYSILTCALMITCMCTAILRVVSLACSCSVIFRCFVISTSVDLSLLHRWLQLVFGTYRIKNYVMNMQQGILGFQCIQVCWW